MELSMLYSSQYRSLGKFLAFLIIQKPAHLHKKLYNLLTTYIQNQIFTFQFCLTNMSRIKLHKTFLHKV
jgi:hypothetical protein